MTKWCFTCGVHGILREGLRGRRGGGGLLYSMSHVAWGGLGRRGGTLGGFIARWEVIFPLAESPIAGSMESWGAAPGGPQVPAYPPPHRSSVRWLCAQAVTGTYSRCRGLPGRENRGRHSRLKLLTGELSGPSHRPRPHFSTHGGIRELRCCLGRSRTPTCCHAGAF